MNDRGRSLAVLALAVALATRAPAPAPAAAPTTPPVSFGFLAGPTPAPSPSARHGLLGTALRVSGMVQRLNDPRKPVRWSFGRGQLSVSIKTP